MAFVDKLHPRNIFINKKINYKLLSDKYNYFEKVITLNNKGVYKLDFKNSLALRALTKALLEEYFNLKIDIPLDRIIPTISLRLNYILWIEDIFKNAPDLKGIDIGCGTACIYGLLGAKKNNWNFVASEIDETSFEYASKNVNTNKLSNKIKVIKVNQYHSTLTDLIDLYYEEQRDKFVGKSESEQWLLNNKSDINGLNNAELTKDDKVGLIKQDIINNKKSYEKTKFTQSLFDENSKIINTVEKDLNFDFCMCNPPFFGSNLEASGNLSRSTERPTSKSISTASYVESVFEGGEVEFVKKIIIQSCLNLKNKIQVYTTMLGKKKSLKILTDCLKLVGITNIGTTEFYQGRTARWGLAWSFDNSIKFPRTSKSIKEKSALKIIIPCEKVSLDEIKIILENVFLELEIKYEIENQYESKEIREISWILESLRNNWTGLRRKRRSKEKSINLSTVEISEHSINDGEIQCSKKIKLDCENEIKNMNLDKLNTDCLDSKSSDLTENKDILKKKKSLILKCRLVIKYEYITMSNSEQLLTENNASIENMFKHKNIILELNWINGKDKEQMQQFHQFLKNKFIK